MIACLSTGTLQSIRDSLWSSVLRSREANIGVLRLIIIGSGSCSKEFFFVRFPCGVSGYLSLIAALSHRTPH